MLHWRGEPTSAKVIPLRTPARTTERDDPTLGDLLDMIGARMRYPRNAEIFGEAEPASYVYKVASGVVRFAKLMSDGRRQISAFYLPGDMFGAETDGVHLFSAEAVSDCEVLVVKRSAFIAEIAHHPDLVSELWAQTMGHLRRAQHHMLLLGRKNAQERIAAFLLEIAERMSSAGDIRLPMSRQDIAVYLGLTIETVSRTLTQLERDGLISIPVSRQIVLRNRAALGVMHGSLAA
ncbi:MAG: helix-turn-helix domain-containing protein [Propylenella sp.]